MVISKVKLPHVPTGGWFWLQFIVSSGTIPYVRYCFHIQRHCHLLYLTSLYGRNQEHILDTGSKSYPELCPRIISWKITVFRRLLCYYVLFWCSFVWSGIYPSVILHTLLTLLDWCGFSFLIENCSTYLLVRLMSPTFSDEIIIGLLKEDRRVYGTRCYIWLD